MLWFTSESLLLTLFIWVYRKRTKESLHSGELGSYSDLARLIGLSIAASEICRFLRWLLRSLKLSSSSSSSSSASASLSVPTATSALQPKQISDLVISQVKDLEVPSEVFVPELFALDLDGTLFDSKGQVSPQSVTFLSDYLSCGGSVVFATGQPVYAAKRTLSKLPFCQDFNIHCICAGGAVLFNASTGKIEKCYEIPKQQCTEVLSLIFSNTALLAEKGDLHVCIETPEKLLVSSSRFFNIIEKTIPGITAKLEPVSKVFTYSKSDIQKFAEVLTHFPTLTGSLRLLCVHENLGYKELLGYFKPVIDKFGNKLCVNPAGGSHGVEITLSGTNKGKALSDYVSRFSFDRNKVVAFGDNVNDLEMLKFAFVSVGMSNSKNEMSKSVSEKRNEGSDLGLQSVENELKKVCTRMTACGCDDSGVVKEMEQMLRGKWMYLLKAALKRKEASLRRLTREKDVAEENLKDLEQILEAGLALEKKMKKMPNEAV